MTSILGLDISSFQLDACLLVDDQAPVLRREVLGKASDPLIERLRRVRYATTKLIYGDFFNRHPPEHRPDWVVVEQPAGRYGLQALLPIIGAITASIPTESQVAWRKASEWRHDLGAKNTKAAGHEAVRRLLGAASVNVYDEHELDALGLSLAWRSILAGQVAA